MTFKEKLEKFKSERVGFRLDSWRSITVLSQILAEESLVGGEIDTGELISRYFFTKDFGNPYIVFNHADGTQGLMVEARNPKVRTGEAPVDLLDVTLEELKEYNG